ncbi:perlucin-like [Neocloeon triangulifer]|uniref:perlucin-like n=1 Tax=Neocloeon triangulifer TaxID=2078957 RepID=UPI00286F426B|nr:perlucin-like [Neocloeon triangulifer]
MKREISRTFAAYKRDAWHFERQTSDSREISAHGEKVDVGTASKDGVSARFTFGNSTYELSDIELDWYMANYACKNKGMFLVSVESEAEDEFIISQLIPYWLSFWTSGNDLYKERQFYWDSTGHLLGPYTNWGFKQPDGGTSDENCLAYMLAYNMPYSWHDAFCTTPYRFICESYH